MTEPKADPIAAGAAIRREFEMTEEQHKRLLDACRPVPYMVFNGVPPPSPQQNANIAWRHLGAELGFVWDSVMPVPGKSERFFTADALGDGPKAQEKIP